MTRTLAFLCRAHRCALLGATALTAVSAAAQIEITDTRETTVRTSESGDVTVTTTGNVTPTTGDGVVVDSSNSVSVAGTISAEDRDDVTGIRVETGNAGDVELSGTIRLTETFEREDTDDDNIPDGPFAAGSGRTGILISGANTFTGNVSTTSGSLVQVEGNDSAGVRLAEGATLDGSLSARGSILATGSRTVGVDAGGDVTGDVVVGGVVTMQGEDAQAIRVAGDVGGGFELSGSVTNTGYLLSQRPAAFIREQLGDEDRLQAGAAIQVSGNVAGGLFFRQVFSDQTDADGNVLLDDDGNPLQVLTARATVNQFGSAPAILVDGEGTPISIGTVAEITDVNDPDFDSSIAFAFVNQGDLTANGTYNDLNATVFEVRDATLSGGINNEGVMQSFAFRSGDSGVELQDGFDGVARVIVLGDNAIAERINNSGIIAATVSEDGETVFADRDAVLPARAVEAVAIDIAAGASVGTLANAGTITAIASGREGTAVVVRDASGTLNFVSNRGQIAALGATSDTSGLIGTNINLVALDLSANTVGVRIFQDRLEADSIAPNILGDVLLGSGDDVLDIRAGSILGALATGSGADSIALSGGSTLDGVLTDTDGILALSVENSTVSLRGGAPVNITEASFDAGSTFRPSIDGQAGTATTLVASGDVSFADGARILPTIETLVGNNGLTRFAIASGANVDVAGDLATLGEGFSPFLYDTEYSVDPATGTLFVDLRVRETGELGLDAVQSAAFESTFDAIAANSELASAILNITNGEAFNAAYNQLLPEFAAAGRQFVLANVDGAVGAVGSHLAATRNGQAQPGGFWIQEFAYYADRERTGLSEQYRGQGFGFTGGIDTALGPLHAVGLNLGFASTEIEDTVGVDEPLFMTTFQLGAYAGYEVGGFGLDGYVGYGFNDFESNRVVDFTGFGGTFRDTVTGEWDGSHVNASLRASYDLGLGRALGGTFWARPVLSLDYLSLTEDAYEEIGAPGIALALDERTVDTTAITGLLNVGMDFMGRRTWVRPALRVGVRSESSDGVVTAGRFAGLNTPFLLEAEDFPDTGIIVGFGVAAGSDYSSFGLDVDTDIRDGFIRTTGRVVVRILF